MPEVWKNISPDYQVSNHGNIRSLTLWNSKEYVRRKEPKILKQNMSTTGYLKIKIRINGVKKDYKVHRLVAMAFLDPVQGKEFVNHIDGNKTNNDVSNLEWCNRSENMQHAYRMGLIVREKKPKAIRPPRDKYHIPKEEFKADILSGMRNVDVAKKYGCTRQLVGVRKYQIKRGEY